jgi:hypothetical protein
MTNINVFEHIFPVVGGSAQPKATESIILIKQVYGTAFSIGGGFFLTAAHVIHSAQENEWCGVGFTDKNKWNAFVFDDTETIDEFDLGIFAAKIPEVKSFAWSLIELPMLESVQAVGYPYSLDIEQASINVRSFAGHVVSSRTFRGLKSKPRIYELSFQCPRGLSGAPLLVFGNDQRVAGLVVGNHSTQMLVFSDKEVIKEPSQETIVERYESLQLGIAIESDAILDCNSRVLGDTLRNHLVKCGLAS